MSHNPKQAEMVRRAISAETKEELKDLYDDWADSYDDDVEGLSYVAPAIGSQFLIDHLANKASKILDVGCGTGLVGIELAKQGQFHIDGIDLSEGMLAIAQGTGHYQMLCQGDINQPFPAELSGYDAAISIGILGIHVGTDALDEMICLVNHGGILAISVRTPYYEPSGYKAHIHALAEQQNINILSEMERPYILDEGAMAMYVVMERGV